MLVPSPVEINFELPQVIPFACVEKIVVPNPVHVVPSVVEYANEFCKVLTLIDLIPKPLVNKVEPRPVQLIPSVEDANEFNLPLPEFVEPTAYHLFKNDE